MYRVNPNWILLCTLLPSQLLFAQTTQSTRTEHVYVGFLDDAREEMVNWKAGVASDRLIRPAFEKTSAGWHQIKPGSVPGRMNWTVAFDGRNLGQISSKAVPIGSRPKGVDFRYLSPVQAIITSVTAVPSVGAPSEQYAPLGMGPTKGRRPLVVVSKPYTSDPDGWKRQSRPPNTVAALVLEAFRNEFPHAYRCKNDGIVQHDWKFPDSSLSFPATYVSNKGSFLIEARLDDGDCYDDDPSDPGSSPWFFITADGLTRRIGSFMSLLDAGDYDNDGRSEVIFVLEQPEDTEGFVLYDADMHKRASLLWTYH